MITLLILRGCMHFNGFLSGAGFAEFSSNSSSRCVSHYDSLDGKFLFIILIRRTSGSFHRRQDEGGKMFFLALKKLLIFCALMKMLQKLLNISKKFYEKFQLDMFACDRRLKKFS